MKRIMVTAYMSKFQIVLMFVEIIAIASLVVAYLIKDAKDEDDVGLHDAMLGIATACMLIAIINFILYVLK